MTTDMDLITNSFDGMAYKGLSQRLHQLKGGGGGIGGLLVLCISHLSCELLLRGTRTHTWRTG